MYPVLFEFGPFHIRTYGVLLSLAFLLGVWMAGRRGRERGVETELINDLSILIILAAIIGARAYYVLTHLEGFTADPLSVLRVWEGGLSMYGGFLLAVVGSYVFLSSRGVPFNRVADIVSPSLAIGVAVTRIGCFFNGCCFGKTTSSFLGVTFPSWSEAGYVLFGETVHPTQLYSSFAGVVIFLILIAADRRQQRDGSLFGLFLVLYSVSRFSIDFLRYYAPGDTFVLFGYTFSYNQVVSFVLFFYGMMLIVRAPQPARGETPGFKKV